MILSIRNLIFFSSALLCFRECQGWAIYNSGQTLSDLSCARVWDSRNYQGRILDINDNDKVWDLEVNNYRPQSVSVRDGCSLAIFNEERQKRIFDKKEEWIWGWNERISKACCECFGCRGVSANTNLQCATLYQHTRCNGCTGFRLHMKDGDEISSFNMLDNMMQSLVVRPGCILTVFDKPKFDGSGYKFNFTDAQDALRENWNRQISSAKCRCGSVIPTHPPKPVIKPITETATTAKSTLPPKPTTAFTWVPSVATEGSPLVTATPECEDSFDCTESLPLESKPPSSPTVPKTTEYIFVSSEESSEDKSPEITSAPATTTKTTTTTLDSFENSNEDKEYPEMTLPTVPTTLEPTPFPENFFSNEESDETTPKNSESEDLSSEEIEEVPTTTTKRTTTTASSFLSSEEDDALDSDEVPTTTTKRTTTTASSFLSSEEDDPLDSDEVPTTTTKRTTTTASSFLSSEEDDTLDSDEVITTTTTRRPTTTTTTPSSVSEEDEEDDDDDIISESEEDFIPTTTTTQRPITTTTSAPLSSEESLFSSEEEEYIPTTRRSTTTTTERVVEEEEEEEEDDDFW